MPIRGLPGPLPAGERLLWQGAPGFGALAREAFHVRKIAVYFVLLMAWRVASGLSDGASAGAVARSVVVLALLALAAVAILSFLAFLVSRTTVYTVTSRRVVLRIGVALRMTVNIPFAIIGSAGLRRRADGTGDIPLALTGTDRIAFLHLWPHARPWRLSRPEPMLRAVPEAERVAEILAGALVAAASPEPVSAAAARADRSSPAALVSTAA